MYNANFQKYFKSFEYGIFTEAKGVGIIRPNKGIDYFLSKMNQQGKHIFIRPSIEQEPFYLLIDDVTENQLIEDHKIYGKWTPGRMVVKTSPRNYQVWLHNGRAMDDTEKSYWLRKYQSDPKATPNRRWGRCPGFKNMKPKYKKRDGSYPVAKLIWWDDQILEQLPPVDFKIWIDDFFLNLNRPPVTVNRRWQYANDIKREMYNRGYDYQTDFSYILALLKLRISDAEIEQRILTERKDWSNPKNSKIAYIRRSICKARELLAKNQNKILSHT